MDFLIEVWVKKHSFEFLFMLMSACRTWGEVEAVYRNSLQTEILYYQTVLAPHVRKLLLHIVNRMQHNGLQSQSELFKVSNAPPPPSVFSPPVG